MEQLDNWGITYIPFKPCAFKNRSGFQKGQGQFLSSEQGGGHIKNLYLRDNKKRNILLVAEQDRQIDLRRCIPNWKLDDCHLDLQKD